MALSDTLSRPVGPLPLGAWLLIGGVAAGYGLYVNRNSEPAPEPTPDPYGDPAVGTGAIGGNWIDLEAPPVTSTAPVDNDAWAVLAMQWFQSHNYDMGKAGQAVANYLGGTLATSDVAGWAMVRTVMMHIGAPPQIVGQDQPAPNQPTPPNPSFKFPGWMHSNQPIKGYSKPYNSVSEAAKAKPIYTRGAGYNVYMLEARKYGNTTWVRSGPPYSGHGWWIWVQFSPGKVPTK